MDKERDINHNIIDGSKYLSSWIQRKATHKIFNQSNHTLNVSIQHSERYSIFASWSWPLISLFLPSFSIPIYLLMHKWHSPLWFNCYYNNYLDRLIKASSRPSINNHYKSFLLCVCMCLYIIICIYSSWFYYILMIKIDGFCKKSTQGVYNISIVTGCLEAGINKIINFSSSNFNRF